MNLVNAERDRFALFVRIIAVLDRGASMNAMLQASQIAFSSLLIVQGSFRDSSSSTIFWRLKARGLSATAIAKALGIWRASIYRVSAVWRSAVVDPRRSD
jgi:hypothetical protein